MIPGYCKICNRNDGVPVFDVSNQRDTYADYLGLQFSGIGRVYKRCEKCNLVYRDIFLSPDQKKALYAGFRDIELRGETHLEYFRRVTNLTADESENDEKYRFLKGHIASTGIHLDIGGGMGVFSYGFSQFFPNWRSYCLEPTPEAGTIASSYGVSFITGYLSEDIDLGIPGQIDLMTINHVLEHVDNPMEFLILISRFMSAECVLYIEVPDQSDLGMLPLSHDRFMTQHEVIYDRLSLSSLLIAANFKIKYLETFKSKRGRNNLRAVAVL